MQEFKEKQLPPRQAVMFLLYKEGKFLFENRKDPNESFFGYTMIPAGKVEPEETPDEAMKREFKEERGAEVINFMLLDSFEEISTSGHHYVIHAYLVTGIDGEIQNIEDEKSDNVWLSLEEAWKKARFVNNRYVLSLVEKLINEGVLTKD